MAASGCRFLRFRRSTSRRARANKMKATAPATPPAIAALFDLEWDVADDTGGVLEGGDIEDIEDVDGGEVVTAKSGL